MIEDGYVGQADVVNTNSDINVQAFIIKELMAKSHNATLVKVVSVSAGTGSGVGHVDLQPLVNQVDGAGKPTPHGILYNVPFLRIQGGTNAVVIDPVVGDIGLAVFASRDISSVKSTGARSNPASRRRNSMADGLYLGGFLNAAPVNYVIFTAGGIKLVSPSKVEVVSPNINLTGTSLSHNGVNVGSTHTHTTPGGTSASNTGVPQ